MYERGQGLDKKRTMIFAALAFGVLGFSNPADANVQSIVKSEAQRQGVPVGLAMKVAKAESNFRCSAVGRAGERGVMQIKPATARGVGYKGSAAGLNNCSTGIRYGMIYLRMAYKKAGGNWYRTAILYNAGLGSKLRSSKYAEKIAGRGHTKRVSKKNGRR
jgi:soluble lytic murein transglycosylase-like protein